MDKIINVRTFTKEAQSFVALVWSDGSLIDVIEENDATETYPTTISEALAQEWTVLEC